MTSLNRADVSDARGSFVALKGHFMKLVARLLGRLLSNIATLVILSAISFALLNFKGPQEIAMSSLGREASADQIEAFVKDHHLGDPTALRFLSWSLGVINGDFGTTIVTGQPVIDIIAPRVTRSIILATVGALIGIASGVLIGTLLARRFGSPTDLRLTSALLLLASVPEFLVALMIYSVFSVWLEWIPAQSSFAFAFGNSSDRAVAYILPALSIALIILPHISRVTRATMSEAFKSQYVMSAKLRGLPEHKVVWQHALINCATPIMGAVGLSLVYAFSGAVAIEYLFNFPGVGALLVESIGSGELFTTMSLLLVFGVLVAFTNIAVDVGTYFLNPRVRFSK
ncbi:MULTISPECIES: ABC transporter permease [Pseudomonas]|uniref:ABC transporter permease n=1 Tax=Pseudomonas sp. FW305-E2 TaxID=2075558 RepID=UPI0013049671|nr:MULTISPECIES: ABC transporter permease [Pseudomonas]